MEQQVVGEVAILGYVALGALIGGAGVLASVLIAVRFILNSPVLIKALESLGESFPGEVRELIQGLAALLLEMTDAEPYVEGGPVGGEITPGDADALKPPAAGGEG